MNEMDSPEYHPRESGITADRIVDAAYAPVFRAHLSAGFIRALIDDRWQDRTFGSLANNEYSNLNTAQVSRKRAEIDTQVRKQVAHVVDVLSNEGIDRAKQQFPEVVLLLRKPDSFLPKPICPLSGMSRRSFLQKSLGGLAVAHGAISGTQGGNRLLSAGEVVGGIGMIADNDGKKPQGPRYLPQPPAIEIHDNRKSSYTPKGMLLGDLAEKLSHVEILAGEARFHRLDAMIADELGVILTPAEQHRQ